MTEKKLRATIIESMEGIIVDHEAREDKDIVEFYADVFVLMATDFAKSKDEEIKELKADFERACNHSQGCERTIEKYQDQLKIREYLLEILLNIKVHEPSVTMRQKAAIKTVKELLNVPSND